MNETPSAHDVLEIHPGVRRLRAVAPLEMRTPPCAPSLTAWMCVEPNKSTSVAQNVESSFATVQESHAEAAMASACWPEAAMA